MGVYVEEEWRYKRRGGNSEKKSLRASKSAFAYKVNKNIVNKEKMQYCNLVACSREVILKFTGGAHTKSGIKGSIKYMSREWNGSIEDCNGLSYNGKEEQEEVVKIMQMNVVNSQRKYNVYLTKNIVFSAPKIASVSKRDAIECVRQTLKKKYPDNFFVLAYHNDTENDHIHIVINVNKDNGKRIDIRKQDIKELKKGFAEKLIEYGYDVKATIKQKYQNSEWSELTSRENINEYEVVDFGSSSYQLNKQNNKNNYLIYRTIKLGKEVTIWGKEILDEIKRNDVRIGDCIKLKKTGEREVKVPVYSEDGSSIISWKSAKRNCWQIENLSRQVHIKHEEVEKPSEIRLDSEDRMNRQLEARESFIHEKKMLLDKDYKSKYEQEQKLNIKHKPKFRF